MNNIHTVSVDGREIRYVLTRKNVKNVNMRIKPDGYVYISANSRVPVDFIENFIRVKSNYIFESFSKYKVHAPTETAAESKIYADGDKLMLLGKEYTLTVLDTDAASLVTVIDDKIVVHLSEQDNLTNVIASWYHKYAEYLFEKLNNETHARYAKHNIPLARLQLKSMKSRWGSCHYTKGKIVINTRLVYYPIECMEYVFCHEYAHFVVPNHSKDFYAVLGEIMPDYAEVRQKLAN